MEPNDYEEYLKLLPDHPFWYKMFRLWCEVNRIEPTLDNLDLWQKDEIPTK